MGACAFTGMQQRDVIVFKKNSVFKSIHTGTAKWRFQKSPLWRAFVKRCVFGDHFHRIRHVWTVDQTGREKLFVFKPKSDTCGRGLKACLHEGGGTPGR